MTLKSLNKDCTQHTVWRKRGIMQRLNNKSLFILRTKRNELPFNSPPDANRGTVSNAIKTLTNQTNSNRKIKNQFMKSTKLFLLTLFLGCCTMTAQSQSTNQKHIRVNQERIEKRIFELAEFGKDTTGKGYRVAYTKGDVEGRNWFMEQMKNAGLEVTIDARWKYHWKKKRQKSIFKTNCFRFTH